MAVAYLPIVVIGIMVVGWLLWMFVFQKKFAAKYAAAAGEAQKKFEENKEALTSAYLTDDEKFGMLQQAVGDEKILGIASYGEPKTLGKTFTEGLKTSITRVKKVNMAQFYMVVTDKYLHCIVSNGENVIDHSVYELDNVKNVSVSRASGINLKNMATGVDASSFNTMKFDYKEDNCSYNLYKMIQWYPKFSIHKNSDGEFYRTYPGIKTDRNKMSNPDTQMEMMIDNYFYEGFKNAMNQRFQVNFPQ